MTAFDNQKMTQLRALQKLIKHHLERLGESCNGTNNQKRRRIRSILPFSSVLYPSLYPSVYSLLRLGIG